MYACTFVIAVYVFSCPLSVCKVMVAAVYGLPHMVVLLAVMFLSGRAKVFIQRVAMVHLFPLM